ncbi:MAG: protein-glutamate O-methyltransferase CheR [Nitrospinae bacterium]|nr:protein-glutamate O-methyltransferase CheR [Nitrospinota bacterium]
MKLKPQEFAELTNYIYKACGLSIGNEKQYLVEQRLFNLAKTAGGGSFQGLIDKLKTGADPRLRDDVIEAMTTNETSFFRDGHPFDTFRDKLLPILEQTIIQRKKSPIQRRGAKVRIWSAAASTGQEAYSMAMLIHEHVKANGHKGVTVEDFDILATDISSSVLAQAISGRYSDMEMARGLSAERRDRFFTKTDSGWAVGHDLQSIVEFRRINITEPFTALGGFDVIFCRNILIYFDDDTKRKIMRQMHQMLSPAGYLLLGACENVQGMGVDFESITHKSTILHRVRQAGSGADAKVAVKR